MHCSVGLQKVRGDWPAGMKPDVVDMAFKTGTKPKLLMFFPFNLLKVSCWTGGMLNVKECFDFCE